MMPIMTGAPFMNILHTWLLLIGLLAAPLVQAAQARDFLVDASWLEEHIEDPKTLVLEVRYQMCTDAPTAEALAAKMHAMRTAELRAGFCLTGPHREDLEILLDGQPARVFGSQGQQRSCVLALKLAEATVVGELFGEHPVLLLDDVLSELDDERQTYLLTRMGEHQTIVTTCDTAAFARTNGKIVYVKGGCAQEKPFVDNR